MLNSLIGIIASSGGVTSTNSYESISTVTVGGGGSSSITFSSIPSTYQHLQIRGIARTNRGTFSSDALLIRANGDTGSNYSWHYLNGDGSSASANAGTSDTSMTNYLLPSSVAGSNIFAGVVLDVLDYASTSKYKTFRNLAGFDNNGSGWITLNSGLWMNTNAITSVTLLPLNGTAFAQYSSFALNGIKG
jgi:hypothetical protein